MELTLLLLTSSSFILLLVTTTHCFRADICYINGKHKCLFEPETLGANLEEVFHGNKVSRNPAVTNSYSQLVAWLLSSFVAVDVVLDCPPPSFTVLPPSSPEVTQYPDLINSTTSAGLTFLSPSLPEVTQYPGGVDLSPPQLHQLHPHRHHRQKRIVGGIYADPADFKFLVNVRGKDGSFCGGVIIAPKAILTAAHCLLASSSSSHVLSPKDVEVYLGGIPIDFSNLLVPNHRSGIRTAQEIIVHPGFYFNATIFQNDIAIIKITKPFKLKSSNFQPISLADEDFSPISGTALGWGTTESFPYSVNPRQVDLPILKDCSWMHINVGFDPNSQFCAGDVPGKDSCDGDSGGPFLATAEVDGENIKVLYGIISYGAPNCGHDAGVYTKVSAYRKWIFEHLDNNDNKQFPKAKNSALTASKFARDQFHYYFVFCIILSVIVNFTF